MASIHLVEELLKDQKIRFDTNRTILMRYSKGKPNLIGYQPKGSDVILFDIFQAVDWIRNNRLVLI